MNTVGHAGTQPPGGEGAHCPVQATMTGSRRALGQGRVRGGTSVLGVSPKSQVPSSVDGSEPTLCLSCLTQ